MTRANELNKQFKRIQKTGGEIDIGRLVLCDICNEDYTDRQNVGGFVFQSKAVCPECAPKFRASIIKFKEQKFIQSECPPYISFADYIRTFRGGDNKIVVTKG